MPTQFPLSPSAHRTVATQTVHPFQDSVSAFRACHERFHACIEYQSLHTGSPVNKTIDSYVLDFDLASKRAFGNDNIRYRVFQMHFIRGLEANEISAELGIERFTLASEIFQIEKLAGQSFVDRGLFPLQSYFGVNAAAANTERRAA